MKTKIIYAAFALVLVFSLAAVIVSTGTAGAATLCVNQGGTGGCYNTIQAAINAANAGDTIIIAEGIYYEPNITIDKDLTIQGSGAGSTIVDALIPSRVFYISATVEISGITIRNGTAYEGGGIYNSGTLTMNNCTVSGNNATGQGGGIYSHYGEVTMTNCTVSGNTAQGGGGIFNRGTLTMTNCTVSGNTANGPSGGIYNLGTLTILCTIVYSNNIYGTYTAAYSIVGSPDPLLGPLQDNGGPTETHALLDGSPAIDICYACTVDTDQRGYGRPVDGNGDGFAYCDIGAYEKGASPTSTPTPTPTPNTIHIDSNPFLFVYGMTGDPPEVIWTPDCDLPDALTNIGPPSLEYPDALDCVITVWGVEDGTWMSWDAELGAGYLGSYGLDAGQAYVITHEDCICTDWEMCD